MKILVAGGGGREHALAWKLAQSPACKALYCAPGNAGTARVAKNLALRADDVDGIAKFATAEKIDLAIVGPEAPLVAGLADRLRAAKIAVVGPNAAAARLEGSKAFAKAVMTAAGVPTARYGRFEDLAAAAGFIDALAAEGRMCVVKADGLAAGKGVIVAAMAAEAHAAARDMLCGGAFGAAGKTVVIEERLDGEEASFIALCHGEKFVPLAGSQDHKRLHDGDNGPNTGGMGAYSPAPVLTPAVERAVCEKVIAPALAEMRRRGAPFHGFLYAGLMLTAAGPYVLEFNVRLGDPETQPLMFRLKTDLAVLLAAAARGDLPTGALDWHADPAVCVVMASRGYPASSEAGVEIRGLDAAAGEHAVVFHAGTASRDGTVVTAGGRVLGVTARGGNHRAAIDNAYAAAAKIHFDGMHYRRDIGRRALER